MKYTRFKRRVVDSGSPAARQVGGVPHPTLMVIAVEVKRL